MRWIGAARHEIAGFKRVVNLRRYDGNFSLCYNNITEEHMPKFQDDISNLADWTHFEGLIFIKLLNLKIYISYFLNL